MAVTATKYGIHIKRVIGCILGGSKAVSSSAEHRELMKVAKSLEVTILQWNIGIKCDNITGNKVPAVVRC